VSTLFTSIRKLDAGDPVGAFDCGQPDLNRYLQRHAWNNQKAGGAGTYVACAGSAIAGYYSLSVAGVDHAGAPARVAKGLARYPVPVMLLARLAVAGGLQGQGLGTALLKDALLRTLQAADIAGIRAVLVHAKNEDARQWYMRFGFEPGPVDPLHLFLLLKDIRPATQKKQYPRV
jgi:GNAT superfamily N-acetyltransferase